MSYQLIKLQQANHDQKEYLQALQELSNSLVKVLSEEEIEKLNLIPRLFVPNKIINFKVEWQDDNGKIQVNQGYRVQHSNLLGPYKGGLRFSPTVNLSIMKFLALEQTFKNALTGLPLGGGKGGSDFDPKGKSDGEIKRFCEAFITALEPHIGATLDVPAGDLGVGEREIGYLFKHFQSLRGDEYGAITGKPLYLNGSLIRKEATGYGLLYFVKRMIESHGKSVKGLKCIISGAGNVALYALKKAQELEMKVIGISNSKGAIIDENGIDFEELSTLLATSPLDSYVEVYKKGRYCPGSIYDYDIPCDVALPCATQNEIDLARAERLVKNGCFVVGEGANMPSSNQAIEYFLECDVLFAPAKAANAGGVSVSYFEMVQNNTNQKWTAEQVDQKLLEVMNKIHDDAQKMSQKFLGYPSDYLFGANAVGFLRLVDALKQGFR